MYRWPAIAPGPRERTPGSFGQYSPTPDHRREGVMKEYRIWGISEGSVRYLTERRSLCGSPTVPGDGRLLIRQGARKAVAARAIRTQHKIQIIRGCRLHDRSQGSFSWIRNGPRR